MSTSACLITWNEEEMIGNCLAYLDSIPEIKEICIVDSFSTDNTIAIINEFTTNTQKTVKLKQNAFTSFCLQRNLTLEMAEQPLILYIDADETYTPQLNGLLAAMKVEPNIKAARIPTIVSWGDAVHYINSGNTDPHIRVWRRGFASFESEIHEELIDIHGRKLHGCHDKDIVNCGTGGPFPDVCMKHHQLLKSENALAAKGQRWHELALLEKSAQKGIPIHQGIWVQWKNNKYPLADTPEHWYDVTTKVEPRILL